MKFTSLLLFGFAMMSIGVSAFATDWTYCDKNQAFADREHKNHDAKKDWICQLPTSNSGTRCPKAQARACDGGKKPGPHDVPNQGVAWFWAQADNTEDDVRCTCGCFVWGTRILTPHGEIRIQELLELARHQEVTVNVLEPNTSSNDVEWKTSRPLRGKNFTVGPEEQPVVRIDTQDGITLALTTNHPVLVVRNGERAMVKASDVKIEDLLLNQSGDEVAIESLSRVALPAENNSVINFASSSPLPSEHVVVANQLIVGDLQWQKTLDVLASRVKARFAEVHGEELEALISAH